MNTEHQDLNAAIGAAVRDTRQQLGLTMSDMVQRLSERGTPVVQSALSQLERGRQRWTIPVLESVSAALGLAVSDLIPGAGMSVTDPAEREMLLVWRSDGVRGLMYWLSSKMPRGQL